MKICYLCADLGVPVGGSKGASAHVRGLVRALAGLGHEVTLVASAVEDAEDCGAPVERVRVPEIAAAISASDSGERRVARALAHLWNNVAVEAALASVLARGADAVYERYSPFAAAGGIVARRLGIPHVLEVNAPLAWEGREYRKQALQEAAELLEERAFASAQLIVAVSRELRDALAAQGVPAAKVAVVPNGVDAELFAPQGESCRDGRDGKVVVGFVGSLKPWHGVEVLVEAFRRLAADPRFHLLVVGAGPQEKLIDGLARELPGRVERRGPVPHREVPRYVRSMDVAVAPYPLLERFYYSPLKVLEYMAAGRAVVAARVGQLAELLRPRETALLVEPGDAEAIAQAIRELAADEALRRRLGANAAEEARRAHSWDARAREIVARIEALRVR